MKPLALLALLALAPLAMSQPAPEQSAASTSAVQPSTPPSGSVDSSKIRLDAQDPAGALADAETALSRGGGADAYAARADAKRALGRPMAEVVADYAAAAKLDPRYIEKYKGLIAQDASEEHPDSKSRSWGRGLNGVPVAEIGAAALLGGLLIAAAVVMLGRRDAHPTAPDDEQPPKKAPPRA